MAMNDGPYDQSYGTYEGYSMDSDQFAGQQQFQHFEYNDPNAGYPGQSPYVPDQKQGAYAGSIFTPDPSQNYAPPAEVDDFENEPPLMEELGINFDHIHQKTMVVLNPFRETDASIMQDTDLAGPLVFCLAFGASLLLAGKVQFGYIYGLGVVGCCAMYFLLNLMSMTGVAVGCVISVLGYCLLPMVLLSFVAIVLSLQGIVGMILTAVTVLWCSLSASKLFVSALSMDHQQPLVAYPCALVYAVFALLTVF